MVKKRLKNLCYNVIKLSFLTWLSIFIAKLIKNEPLNWEFYAFTSAMIGIQIYKDINGGANNAGNTTQNG